MLTYTNKVTENKHSISVNNSNKQQNNKGIGAFQFVNKRPEAIAQRKIQETINNSTRMLQLKSIQASADNYLTQGIVQRMFSVGAASFKNPQNHTFTAASALQATEPIPRGEAGKATGLPASSGVQVGQVGSYGYVQHLEQTGDDLTGDHQPSGAAIKESIREMLHVLLNKPLTRSMAKNAYKKAITIIMTDVWHKLYSRTYGGRNTKAQIIQDSQNLMSAAIEDWKRTVPGLKAEGFTDAEILQIWDDLCEARKDFFATGNAQVGTL